MPGDDTQSTDSGAEGVPESLPRHEWWRRAYATERYMRGLTDLEVDLRFADIITNSTILTREGKIGLSGIQWIEKFTHVQEELGFRGKGLPSADSLGRRLVVPSSDAAILGAKVRAKYPNGIADHFVLFKYGKEEHLHRLLRHGELRLCPASSYNDPSLNSAAEDDELQFEKIDGHTRTQYMHQQDFYCFCSAWIHSERLISDFGATAVLVIDKPYEFFLRMANALDRTDYLLRFNRVTYVDPLLLGDHDVPELPFTKHMRFAYQFEHRWVAQPPRANVKLQTANLHMGSIEDIAEIYV